MIAVFQILTSSSPIFKLLRQTNIKANWSPLLFLIWVVSRSDLRAVFVYYHWRFRSFLSFSMQIQDNISNWATTASFHAHSSVHLSVIIRRCVCLVCNMATSVNDRLRRNCILKHVVEGKKKGTGRRGRSRKQLLYELKEK